MEPATFDRGLRSLAKKQLFLPFQVELLSGESFVVDHPEALVYRGGMAVYVAPDGFPHLFDHESVSRLIAGPKNGRRR